MKVINNWDIEANFWEINPQIKIPEIYKNFFKSDKSRDKKESSTIMWGVALFTDFDSKFRQLGKKDRQDLICNDVYKDNKFNWKLVEPLIDAWEIFKPVAVRQMMQWERLMSEKDTFLSTLKYDEETAEMIEKLLLSNSKLYKEYEDITSRLIQDGNEGQMLGGGIESLSEKGEI